MNRRHKVVLIDIKTIAKSFFAPHLHGMKLFSEQDARIKQNFDIDVLTGAEECVGKKNNILLDIYLRRPDIVGLSCYMWNAKEVAKTAREIKTILPECLIIIGGPQVCEHAMLETPEFDIGVLGEGEHVFRDLLNAYHDGIELSHVHGLILRGEKGIVKTPPSRMLQHLDDIPQAYAGLDDMKEKQERLMLEISRGCPSKCAYCMYTKNNNRLRFFSLGRIKDALISIQRLEPTVIYLLATNIFENKEYFRELCTLLKKHCKASISIEGRAESITPEIVRQLEGIAVNNLEIGLQTTDTQVMHNIRRKMNTQKFTNGIGLLHKAKIKHELQLIAGLPGDNFWKLSTSVQYVIQNMSVCTSLRVFRLHLLNGSHLFEQKERFGIFHTHGSRKICTKTCSQDFQEIYKTYIFSETQYKEMELIHQGLRQTRA